MKDKETEIKNIETQLSDIATRSQAQNNEILGIQDEINSLEADNRKLERVEREMNEEDIERKSNELRKFYSPSATRNGIIKQRKPDLTLLSDKQFYAKKLENLRAEWKEISSGQPEINDDEFVCPTCKRPFEQHDVEEKKEDVISNFNKGKAEKLENNKK